ncbi:TIM barrel protein [Schleiferiaceae bacterium]|nr:TIM barrel protein [Schleiferiaceae bacterium]
MKTLKGPAIFVAQFADDSAPFNSWSSICDWASGLGYKGIQIPSWDTRLINLENVALNQDAADELKGVALEYGIEITELSTHLQGQLVAVHPAFDAQFDAFAPATVQGNSRARTAWAVNQLKLAGTASRRLGLNAHPTFSGALAWPYFYPWPQRPSGLVEEAFKELGKRWMPILNHFEDCGVDIAFEIHPGEDLHDGATFEKFLDEVGNHGRANMLYDPSHLILQGMDYLGYIDLYHERIKAFHVKDAEFNPNARTGAYGGYLPWLERAGRFRSVGDGQIDFTSIFSKLAQYNYGGWAVLEWECCLKDSLVGAKEGAERIANWIIPTTSRSFDDFAATDEDSSSNRKALGLDE